MTPAGPTVAVVMGVSGCGKSTVAARLAERLGWTWVEGDDLHPAANVAKMRAGQPLTDADREPWLDRVAARIGAWLAVGGNGVITCSALRRRYRDRIIGGRAGVRLIYLHGDPATLRGRLAGRQGHFMPASLLDSQLDTLEPPADDEAPIRVAVEATPDEIVAAAIAGLMARTGGEPRP